MKKTLAIIAIALLFAGAAVACPGTWVQQQGQTAIQNGTNGQSQAVGAGYIAARNGPAPGTPLHSVLHQFTTGTAIVEEAATWHPSPRLSEFSSTPAKIDAALGPYDGVTAVVDRSTIYGGHGTGLPSPLGGSDLARHFHVHFVDGFISAGATPGGSGTNTTKHGG